MMYLEYLLLVLFLGYLTYNRGALDLTGSIFMAAMAIIIIYSPTAGFNWFILLITFLLLGVLATKYKTDYKKELGISEGTRTAKNVISNGIIAFIAASFGLYGPFIGAIATATADTLASEIGVTQVPRLITTFKKVKPGTDGAISLLGTGIAILGAGIIGILAYFLGISPDPLISLRISVIAGTVGCFADSLLGAILERRNYINNEHVNLLATAVGGIIGFLLSYWINFIVYKII